MAHVTRRDLALAAALAGAGLATAAAAQPMPEVQGRDTTRGPAPQEQG